MIRCWVMLRAIFVRPVKCLPVILLASAICSCRSSRNLDNHVQSSIQEEMQRMINSLDSLMANAHLLRSEFNERFSNMKLENKTVYYSAPDSTGKQYPTAVSETKSESNEKEKSQSDTELDISVSMLSAKVDSLSAKLNSVLDKQEKVVELSWWQKNKDKLYIGFAVVIVGWLLYNSRKK